MSGFQGLGALVLGRCTTDGRYLQRYKAMDNGPWVLFVLFLFFLWILQHHNSDSETTEYSVNQYLLCP